MKLSSYVIADKDADGNLYAVVTLDNGTKFGQWARAGATTEVDAQIQVAVDRIAAPVIVPAIPLGTARTIADIAASAAVKPSTLSTATTLPTT